MDLGQKNYWKTGMAARELNKLQLVGIGTEIIDTAAQ